MGNLFSSSSKRTAADKRINNPNFAGSIRYRRGGVARRPPSPTNTPLAKEDASRPVKELIAERGYRYVKDNNSSNVTPAQSTTAFTPESEEPFRSLYNTSSPFVVPEKGLRNADPRNAQSNAPLRPLLGIRNIPPNPITRANRKTTPMERMGVASHYIRTRYEKGNTPRLPNTFYGGKQTKRRRRRQ
jgi:hypothetical protein